MKIEEMISLNFPEGIERLSNNKALYARLLGKLKDMYPELDKKISDSLAAGDDCVVQQLVHSLKGAAGNLSVSGVYQAAVAFDIALKAHAWDDYPRLQAELVARFDGFLKELAELEP